MIKLIRGWVTRYLEKVEERKWKIPFAEARRNSLHILRRSGPIAADAYISEWARRNGYGND